MPQQGYSIGRDVTLVALKADGSALRFGKVTAWTAKPDMSNQKIKGLDGSIDNLRWHEGWSGSFTIERRGPEIDAYFDSLETAYYAGDDEPTGSLQQTITEPDGSISQFRFEKVVYAYDDAGDWAADKSVNQRVTFMAARRIQQA